MRRSGFLLAALAALFLLGGALSMFWKYKELKTWQAVLARVVAIDAVKFKQKGVDRFRGEILIRYSVNDVYHRVPLSLPAVHSTEESARAELFRYAPGTTMQVFYNPANFDDMILDAGGSARFYVVPAILTTIGLIFGGFCVGSIQRLRVCLCPGCASSVERWHRFCFACAYKLPKQKKLVRI